MGPVLGFFLLEILFFVGFLAFSIIRYKQRFNMRYDLRNTFPYELNFESKFSDNLFGNVLFLMMVLSNLMIYVFSMNVQIQSTLLFNLVSAIINSISLVLVLFVPLKLLKTHLAGTTVFIISTFLNFASIGFTSLNFYSILNYNHFVVLAIISFVFAIFVFLIIMNPKLTTWANAEKVEVDGQVTYKRPKYIVLAFSEWLCIILTLVSATLQFILFTFVM
ncbi:MAG: hypothetical protein IKB70_11555 [Bacilli bacterium]|nr:hypothetical protein [Bacilli bacterium]